MMESRQSATNDGSSGILSAVLAELDAAGIAICLLHGHERFPPELGSDVDCIIDGAVSAPALLQLLHDKRARVGAVVVRSLGMCVTLAGRNADGSPCFLTLDFSHDCEVDGLLLKPGRDILASRRRLGEFWIPAADVAFGCYLTRSIAKGRLDDERIRKLARLCREDLKGCEAQIRRYWNGENAEMLVAAARIGHWEPAIQNLPRLRLSLMWRTIARDPVGLARRKVSGWLGRVERVVWPHGVSIVVLGPDGAGKSSAIEGMGRILAPAFSSSTCWGFAPHWRRLLRRPALSVSQPHGLAPRTLPVSLIRAGYWVVFNCINWAQLRWTMARSALVLYDRHFVDILVDATRYRYGGPDWLLRLIWRFAPKPDLIVLLDAPPEVLQTRKQEVPFAVTVRQCRAYRDLVASLDNGWFIDAAQPFGGVLGDLGMLVVDRLAARHALRHGLQPICAARPASARASQQALE